MEDQAIFRTVMRGFKKEDVLSYIDNLRLEHQKEADRWKTEAEQLRERLNTANAVAAAMPNDDTARQDEQIAALQSKLAAVTAECEELKKASAETGVQKEELTALRQECDTLRREREVMEKQAEETAQAMASLWEQQCLQKRRQEEIAAFAEQVRESGERLVKQATAFAEDTPAPVSAKPVKPKPEVPDEPPVSTPAPAVSRSDDLDRWLY